MSSTITIERPELKRPLKTVSLRSYWLSIGELRLNASFYAQDVSTANRLIKESGYEPASVDDLSRDVFYLTRQKRLYARPNIGDPYLMPSELFFFKLTPSKFVFGQKLRKPEEWYVDEDWILLTRSGKLGMPIITTKPFKKFIISDDVIRIVPKEDSCIGFLYAFLSTWLGHALLVKDEYGVTVKHIEPHHVRPIPVPLYPKEIQSQIHKNVIKAFHIREKARNLLEKSEQMLLEELAIPKSKEIMKTNVFKVKSSNLELRLDGSYHDPVLKEPQNALRNGKYHLRKMGDKEISHEIFIPNRFKRIYVREDYGIPFLSGTNIFQIKPYDLKYISKRSTKNLERYLLKEGMVLVTARGTIGRIMPVTKSIDGWSASDNVARIIPNKLHFGFLTSFLNTIYGQCQLTRQVGGSVVNLLEPQHISKVQVPVPPREVQERIGKMAIEAYELKQLANKIEDETVKTLEDMLSTHRKTEVNEEYLREINAYVDSFELIGNEEFRRSLEEMESGEVTSFEEFKKEHGF